MVRTKYWSRVLFLITPFLVSQKRNLKVLLEFHDRSSSDSLLMLVRPSLFQDKEYFMFVCFSGKILLFMLFTVIV